MEQADHSPYADHWQLTKVAIDISVYFRKINNQLGEFSTTKTATYLVLFEIILPGQGSMLHSIVLFNSSAHDDPPLRADWLIVRFDFFSPPPHVAEHKDQCPQDDNSQLTRISRIGGLKYDKSVLILLAVNFSIFFLEPFHD